MTEGTLASDEETLAGTIDEQFRPAELPDEQV